MFFEENDEKITECMKILKPLLCQDGVKKRIFTIIKSLGYTIGYISDDDTKLWNKIIPNDRWSWKDLLEIIQDNIDETKYAELIEYYFYDEEKLIFDNGDRGLSKIFSNIMRNKLVITNVKGDGFLLNKETNQYEKKVKCVLVDMVSDVLSPVIKRITDKLSKENQDWEIEVEGDDTTTRNPYINKLTKIKEIKKMLNTTEGCNKIYKGVIPKLLNLDFEKDITINKNDYTFSVSSFLNDMCIIYTNDCDKDIYKMQPHLLYEEYKTYCNYKAFHHASIKQFGSYMNKRLGKVVRIQIDGVRTKLYRGIKLKNK